MKLWILFNLVAVGLCGRCKNNRFSTSTMAFTSTVASTSAQEPTTTSSYVTPEPTVTTTLDIATCRTANPTEPTETTTTVTASTSQTENNACTISSLPPNNCPPNKQCDPLEKYGKIIDNELIIVLPAYENFALTPTCVYESTTVDQSGGTFIKNYTATTDIPLLNLSPFERPIHTNLTCRDGRWQCQNNASATGLSLRNFANPDIARKARSLPHEPGCSLSSIPQICVGSEKCSPLENHIVVENSTLRYDVPVDFAHIYLLVLDCHNETTGLKGGSTWNTAPLGLYGQIRTEPLTYYLPLTCTDGRWICTDDSMLPLQMYPKTLYHLITEV